jgi:hypothetical protein
VVVTGAIFPAAGECDFALDRLGACCCCEFVAGVADEVGVDGQVLWAFAAEQASTPPTSVSVVTHTNRYRAARGLLAWPLPADIVDVWFLVFALLPIIASSQVVT